ncbi:MULTISPECIES: MalY/PatB family protein [Bacteroidota]|uniref:MalY/PatB family protein n=1 Tax=Bacteroidota TaxID=976 RepID=UPI001CBCDB4A|nr:MULTISPECIES: PatB family C-S lyase [Bacteroidota]MBZ4190785.1 PatB family C-S lyase [Niabella beijingensis]UMQ40825.1 PatB family C-S lyase [Chryseobacterium sp. Y16C]
MKYNFDEIIDREGTNSLSYDGWRQYIFNLDNDTKFPFENKDYIRMWVADMDFSTPPEILEAIKRRLDRKILGYTYVYDETYFKVLYDWFLKRYQWEINADEMVISPGIIPALNRLIGLLTDKDDAILINTPSYTPFKKAGDYNNRKVFYSDLEEKDGYYIMSFEDIEQKLSNPANKIKVFILCNPHNPTGRVWTEEELLKIGKLCLEWDIWIISDEIHCDLLRNGQQHIPLARLFPDSDRIITCTAPSKTFNLAGNLMSHIFIPNKEIREEWELYYTEFLSPLSVAATQAAYQDCEDWLEQLKVYLDENFAFLKVRLKELLPNARFSIPEATYLAWINIEDYLPQIADKNNLTMLFANNGVLIEDGKMFVSNGDGYIRINVACPRSVLDEGIGRIAKLLNNL